MIDPAYSEEPSPALRAAPARNFFVDLLRGLSILIVMCMHVGLPPWVGDHAPHRVKLAIASAYYGVTIFFVVSGYLISMTSIQRFRSLAEIDIGTFAKLRFGRIVPFLVLVLVSLITLGRSGAVGFVFPKGNSMLDATTSVLSLQFNDWYVKSAQHGQVWDVMWSLSIEEIFYVFLPIACRVLRTKKMIVAWLIFSVPFALYGRSQNQGLYLFSGCVDALSMGVLTALLAERKRPKDHLFFSLGGMLTGLAGAFYVCQFSTPWANPRWGPLLVALAAGVFIYSSLYFPKRLLGGGIERWPLKMLLVAGGLPLILVSRLGRYSYEAYLLHLPAKRFVLTYVWPECDGLALIVFIGVGSCLVNTFFTEPMNVMIRGRHRRPLGRTTRWRRLAGVALVALGLVAVPNLIVKRDRLHPTSVVSVSTKVLRDKMGDKTIPLIVYGESGDADFVSIKKAAEGTLQLQFDHWGLPPVVKPIKPELVKATFTVVLDCKTPAVLVEGVPVLTEADMPGFSSHHQIAIGHNDIGGITMAAKADGQIESSLITFNNDATSTVGSWRLGE